MKVLIIDDEKYTREGIKRNIDWGRLGITHTELAEDGMDGVDRAFECKPDIVICDINMPLMNGIECVDQIVSFLPACKVIFLSGYSDKTYLKSAIRLRAIDYIEKPLNIVELTHVIEKTVQLLKKEQVVVDPFQFLYRMDQDTDTIEAVTAKISQHGYHFPLNGHYVAIAVKCSFSSEMAQTQTLHENTLLIAWKEMFRIPKQHWIAGRNNDGLIITYLQWGMYINKEQLHETCKSAMYEMKKILGARTHFTIGIGAVLPGLYQIKRSEDSALVAVDQDFILGTDQIIQNDYIDGYKNYGNVPDFQQFLAYFRQYRLDEALACLKSEEEKCSQSIPLDKIYIQKLVLNTTLQLYQFAEEHDRERSSTEKSKVIQELATKPTLSSMIQALGQLSNLLYHQMDPHQTLLIRKVKGYIAEHYQGDCTIVEVSRSVNMSPSYLSVLFKKQTGLTINEYTNKLKLEKAQVLLKDPTIRIYEIAQLSGYQDHNYFTRIFRKLNGCSPSEYRRKQTL